MAGKGDIKNFGDNKHVLTDADRAKGAKTREKHRLEKKTYFEIASALSSQKWKPSDKDMLALKKYGLENEELNNQFLFVFSVFTSAAKGNAKAMQMWIDMTSQYTEEKERLEVEKMKAEIERLKSDTIQETDIEDLTPLAELLSDALGEKNTDDE